MCMAVMQVGIMRMRMGERRVPVPVRMRLADGFARQVRVAVVLVVHMAVLVFHRLVYVLVIMPLGEVEI